MTLKRSSPRRKFRFFLLFIISAFLTGVLLLMAFSSRPTPTAEDITYINRFLNEWGIHATPATVHASFDKEIEFIRSVQDSIVANIQHKGIQEAKFGNIQCYYQNRQGMCYDRVVFMEKILDQFNFKYRHLFVYYLENNKEVALWDLFRKGTGSHALTEVKTSKGWMVIGSNADWMGIDSNKQPFTIYKLKSALYKTGVVPLNEQPLHGVNFWKQHPRFRYVYGVYSRHGGFLPPHNAVPDYNFRMLLYNL
jgi:hypothetical protein